MKIMLIITKSELGGAQSVVINIANELCKRHQIIVVAGEGDGKMWELIDQNVKKINCSYLKRNLSPLNDFRTYLFFKKLQKIHKPDVIHLHSSKAGMLGRLAFNKNKIVYTVHGFDSIRIAYKKLLPIEKIMQFFCNTIVGVSKYDVENLLKCNISHNVKLVYNGIKEQSTTVEHLTYIREQYPNIVLCIARNDPQKRIDLFIETAKLLPQFAFVWIGNQTKVNCSISNTYFLGNIVNARRYCKDADIFMLPSNYEGLPMVIIEAMSHSKPIVASHVGGNPEIVINNYNGYTVENNAHLFAEKINYIIKNKKILESFSRNSYQLYKEKFSVDIMVNNYFTIYNNIYKN